MHREQESDLISANTELERTLKSLRKTKRAESAAMTDEGLNGAANQEIAAEIAQEQDTLEDL